MARTNDLDEIRAGVEEQQKAVLWEDARKGGGSVDGFLWKGDPRAKPIQRAGLVVFGLMFLLLAVVMASIPFQKHFEGGWPVPWVMGLGCLLIALRLIRNAFRRPKRRK
jgi:peptidoglycan/LPS O-acetylase OafA/YrhL